MAALFFIHSPLLHSFPYSQSRHISSICPSVTSRLPCAILCVCVCVCVCVCIYIYIYIYIVPCRFSVPSLRNMRRDCKRKFRPSSLQIISCLFHIYCTPETHLLAANGPVQSRFKFRLGASLSKV